LRYDLVFDVVERGYANWPFAAAGMAFVIVGVALVVHRRRLPVRTSPALPFLWLVFSVCWTTVALFGTGRDYRRLSSALREGRCRVVEGAVTQFHPMRWGGGSDSERFVVDGQRFQYSDYEVTAGFNNTSSHGGPMREGLRVRIHHLNGEIARLEIAH
jgi:hypothetical protein